MFPFPTPLPFPSPRAIDLGVVRIEFNKQCVVFKRPDREFPHVTQYFTKNHDRDAMWLHLTDKGRWGRKVRTTLVDWDETASLSFANTFTGLLVPRVQGFLRPASLEQMRDDGWLALVPGPDLLTAYAKVLLHKRSLCLWRLENLLQSPDGEDLLHSMCEHLVEPVQLRAPGNYLAIRVKDDIIESGYLQAYRLAPGFHSWFFLPREWLSIDDTEFFETLAPGLLNAMQKIFDALEIDLKNGR